MSNNVCPHCDNIDFDNILWVSITNTSESYHEEEHEEFDIVMSDFLTQQDGWQHYETKTVIENVFDGIEYTFMIVYSGNETEPEYRTYHESNFICQKLLEKIENNPVTESMNEAISAISNIGTFRELSKEEIKENIGPCAEWARNKECYLHYSKQELIESLSEHYSKQEINDALSQLNIDFRQEATIRAREYVNSFGGSYKNLMQYLADDKFTPEEVDFGAANCGIDWKEEALRAAKKYIESNGNYSYEAMIWQLCYFDFSKEEAEYAAKALNLSPDKDPQKWHLNSS